LRPYVSLEDFLIRVLQADLVAQGSRVAGAEDSIRIRGHDVLVAAIYG
jgi:hypothetical protein